jgi:hypothetical protein
MRNSKLLLLLVVAKILDIFHLLKPKTSGVLETGSASAFGWNREMGEPTPWFEAHFFKWAHHSTWRWRRIQPP